MRNPKKTKNFLPENLTNLEETHKSLKIINLKTKPGESFL